MTVTSTSNYLIFHRNDDVIQTIIVNISSIFQLKISAYIYIDITAGLNMSIICFFR